MVDNSSLDVGCVPSIIVGSIFFILTLTQKKGEIPMWEVVNWLLLTYHGLNQNY